MKILSISAQKPHSTGSGTYLTEMVNSFDRLGFSQAVVAGIYPSDTVSFPDSVSFYPVYFSEDFPIYGMSDAMPYPSSLYSEMDEASLDKFEEMFKSVIAKAVDDLDPDIIYCHHLFILTAIVREMFPERFVIGQCHGSDLRQFKNNTFFAGRVKSGVAFLDKVLALHDEQASEIIELYGISPTKVVVVGSGYNARLFNTAGRKPRNNDEPIKVVFAGKISKAKGVLELFSAIRELSSKANVHDFEVSIAGGCQDEDVEKELNSLLNDYSDANGSCVSVRYLGLLDQDELAKLFKASDVFVLPSFFEGLGLVLIEAMASGLVPVATRLPGVKEWIDASIPGNNVIYVQLPRMASIDEPVADDIPAFVANLTAGLRSAFERCEAGFEQPDTSKISWDKMAENFTKLSKNQ